jgi:hypothetical protein
MPASPDMSSISNCFIAVPSILLRSLFEMSTVRFRDTHYDTIFKVLFPEVIDESEQEDPW